MLRLCPIYGVICGSLYVCHSERTCSRYGVIYESLYGSFYVLSF